MASLNDLDKKLTRIGDSVAKRAQDAVDSVATPNKIAEKRRQLEECYAALGKAATDNSNGTLPQEYQGSYQQILASQNKIKELNARQSNYSSETFQNFQARQASSAAQAGTANAYPNAPQTPPTYANPHTMPQQSGYYPHMTEEQLPAKFKPLGAWAYFGWTFIFSIPLIGIIVALIKAFGNTENVNLRNYARSMFCYICIMAIFLGIIFGTTGCLAAML